MIHTDEFEEKLIGSIVSNKELICFGMGENFKFGI